AHALGDRLDRAPFAGPVSSLEDDADLSPLLLNPFLELHQLDVQLRQLFFVFLSLELFPVVVVVRHAFRLLRGQPFRLRSSLTRGESRKLDLVPTPVPRHFSSRHSGQCRCGPCFDTVRAASLTILRRHLASPPTRWFALRSCLRLLPFAASAWLAACSEKAAPPAAVPEVSVVEVIRRDVPIGAELTATMTGLEDVELRARVEGYLRSIDYSEGSQVKKGQLLFTIEESQYRQKVAEAAATLSRAQAALSKADLDVSRYRPLAAERAISQAELDNAIAAQKAARAQVDATRAELENARL